MTLLARLAFASLAVAALGHALHASTARGCSAWLGFAVAAAMVACGRWR